MKSYEQEKIKAQIAEVWKCLEVPLRRHKLLAVDSEHITRDYPIKVDVNIFGMAVVQINPETLTRDPNVAWNVMCDMEEALKEKYIFVERQFIYGFRYLKFQVSKEK